MKDQESKTEYVVCYADTGRLYGMGVMAVVMVCVVGFAVYAFTQTHLVQQKLFWVALAIACACAFVKYLFVSYRAYLAKAIFSADGIECTLLGRLLKSLRWDEVKDIVCVTYVRRSFTSYMVFSGHELTEEEKKKSIEYAGLKNDMIVVKYSKKLVKLINEVHEFSYKDETRK